MNIRTYFTEKIKIPYELTLYLVRIISITLIITLTSVAILFYFSVDDEVKKISKYVSANVDEFGINFQYICDISGCSALTFGNNKHLNFIVDKNNGIIKRVSEYQELDSKQVRYISYNKISIPIVLRYNNQNFNIILVKDISDKIFFYFSIFLSVAIGMVILFVTIIIYIHKEEKKFYTMTRTYEKDMSDNIIMTYISENIHHELMTPMKTIRTKLRVLEGAFSKAMSFFSTNKEQYEMFNQYHQTFRYMNLSVDQVYSVLENMKNTKLLKHDSSENMIIYDVISHTINLLKIVSPIDFEFFTDDDLLEYKLTPILTHGTLINVLLNHVKNSLEATADEIYISFVSFEHGYLKIRITDNGNGISEAVVDKIFDNDFSTKSSPTIIRGNGLTLNRQIIRRSGGDIKLHQTSSNGTDFDIILPATKN